MSEELIIVHTATTQPEADFIESVLRGAGIEVIHDHEYATTAGFSNTAGIHLAVRKEDVDRAHVVLKEADFDAAGEEE
jgi:hypothetical protein